MDNGMAREVGCDRPPEGSHLGKFTQYSPGWYSPPTHTKPLTWYNMRKISTKEALPLRGVIVVKRQDPRLNINLMQHLDICDMGQSFWHEHFFSSNCLQFKSASDTGLLAKGERSTLRNVPGEVNNCVGGLLWFFGIFRWKVGSFYPWGSIMASSWLEFFCLVQLEKAV